MRARTRLTSALTALAALMLAACGGGDGDGYGGGGGPTDPPPAANTIVGTASLTFSPATLTVDAGEVVTFAFRDVPHNVFFEEETGAPTDIDGANTNVSVERTFATAGTFRYDCHIHPGMRGSVVVR
jgi:plastocyanin